ncbi:ABC transporter substrate-binding protein [Saccharothrix sp.]|uniref:ABC transporter substrate-binding protein n=1 Tax=Saccharothrix sp. TaxID=1873460 RepID=UPI002810D0DA|nr:ABC transporter substrate-binding protein [Saccharothrix sp.]
MKDTWIDRRSFLRGLGAVAATSALAACGTGTSRSAGGGAGTGSKTLVVRNSGGAYGDANMKAVLEPFMKETGIEIKVINPNYAQMLAQIKQGRPQFDLIDNSMIDFVKFAQEDATQQIDYDRLKSVKNADIPKNLLTPTAVGKNYWGSVIGYRTDAFGGKKPNSWADFWDTAALPGSRGLQHVDADIPELEFALLADGVPMDQLYPLDLDRAFRKLDEIKGSVKKYWDTGALPGVLLGRREVDASTVWYGRLNDLIKQGQPLAYVFQGARRQSNGWAIPRGAANVDAAYQLIDYSLRPEVQAHFSEIYPFAPVVPAAYKSIKDEVAATLLGAPQNLETGFDANVEWWVGNDEVVTKRWQEWARV